MDFLIVRKKFYLPKDAWILALSATIWSIGSSVVNPFQSIYFFALGANSLFIGYLLAMGSAVTALMQLLGGYVADIWGRRKVIIIFSQQERRIRALINGPSNKVNLLPFDSF